MYTYSLVFNLLVIAFMCFCLTRLTNVLCKIVAAVYIVLGVVNVLWYFGLFPFVVMHHLDSIMHIGMVGMILFIFQLFRTASEVRSSGATGAEYNYILGAALILMLIISLENVLHIFDHEWFYSLRMRTWPEIIVLTTVIVMKAKKVVLNKDEDLLLWYFAASSLFVLCYYFL